MPPRARVLLIAAFVEFFCGAWIVLEALMEGGIISNGLTRFLTETAFYLCCLVSGWSLAALRDHDEDSGEAGQDNGPAEAAQEEDPAAPGPHDRSGPPVY